MQTKPQYIEKTYTAPYRGLNVQAPEDMIPESDCLLNENLIFRNDELRSAPKFKILMDSPSNQSPIKATVSFMDENNIRHTLAITATDLYQLIYTNKKNPAQWLWNKVDSFRQTASGGFFNTQTLLNKAYWTTNYPGVYYWNGITATISEATKGAGTVPLYGGAYFGELGFHLLLLNTAEWDTVNKKVVFFPQRVRWAASGNPTAWEPSVNPNAGFTDQLDVPDVITGFMSIGKMGYIFRTNGITQMSLTGQGLAPFNFDHLWASDRGIGSLYSKSIASYGSVGIFVSFEQIYQMTVSSFEPIGGEARDAILNDLADASGIAISFILPGYSKKFIYLTYNLAIPTTNGTKLWQFNIEDKNWTYRFLNGINIISEPKLLTVK